MKNSEIFYEGLVGMDTGKSLVRITCPAQKFEVLVESEDARKIALAILACAESSESDLAVFRFLTEKLGSTVDESGGFLHEMRQFRVKQ